MSNSGKIWDTKEVYKLIRNNTWSRGAGRGFACGGGTPTNVNTVDVVTLSTTGNAADYGDLATIQGGAQGYASTTRGIIHGGEGAPGYKNDITYINFSSQGNGSDFGDSTQSGGFGAAHSNNTRGVVAGFYTPLVGSPHISNVMEFTTMASIGNATDFGDLGQTVIGLSGYGNNTKAFYGGGSTNGSWSAYSNRIDTVTIATTGNSSDYGDLNTAVNRATGFSSTTRGITAGGYVSPGAYTVLVQQNDLSSGATGTDFGDLTVARSAAGGVDNSVRGSVMGGYDGSSVTNHIDFMQIATSSNATDFGDLSQARIYIAGVDDSNAGLDFSQTQRASVTYMPGSGRALYSGGQTAPSDALTTNVNMIHIPTTGNTVAFGDLATATSNGPGNGASTTRSIVYSGYSPASPYYDNTIQATTFSSLGNYFDFGDPSQQRYALSYGNIGSPTRAVFMGGYAPGSPYFVNIIDYITIATVGNGTDFGDLAAATNNVAGCSSSTRGIGMGGYTGSQDDTIQYVTIASTGNATDFGNLAAAKSGAGGLSSSTRGIIGGGKAPSAINVIEYITIASTGNGTDFGDLTQARNSMASASNSSRGVFMGGSTPSKVNTVDFITIASTGNAADFGDTKVDIREGAGTSDSHGGLQA